MSNAGNLTFVIIVGLLISACNHVQHVPDPQWTDTDREVLLEGLTNSLDSLKRAISEFIESDLSQKPDSNSWSVAEVVEHLVLQDQAYYRELIAVSSRPEETVFIENLNENDDKFLAYATDPNPGQADWFAVPTGNYRDFGVVLNQFELVRSQTIKFIEETSSDLRRHYTYRNISDQLLENEFYRIRKVRDLHQLILNEIAHSYRHMGQIGRIKHQLKIH